MTETIKAEMMKGLSDLPVFLITLILGLVLLKEKKAAYRLFLTVAVAALLGNVVHSYQIEKTTEKILWVILYVLMYECVRLFAIFTAGHLRKPETLNPVETKVIVLSEVVFCLGSIILELIDSPADIYLYVVFAAAVATFLFIETRKQREEAKKMYILMLILIAAIALQALKGISEYLVTAAHIVLCIGIVYLYLIAKED